MVTRLKRPAKPGPFTSTQDRQTKSFRFPKMRSSLSTTRQTPTGSLSGWMENSALFPANYIEVGGDGGQVEVEAEAEEEEPPPAPKPPALPSRSPAEDLPSPPLPPRAPSPGQAARWVRVPPPPPLASVLARNSAPARPRPQPRPKDAR